jgi:hypothetical protein
MVLALTPLLFLRRRAQPTDPAAPRDILHR